MNFVRILFLSLLSIALGLVMSTPAQSSAEASAGSSGSVAPMASTLSLNNLESVRILGRGAAGEVSLRRDKVTGNFCAVKSIKKSTSDDDLKKVARERRALQSLRHPFIARFEQDFEDTDYFYFVTEALLGRELFDHICSRGRFSEEAARFYAASIVLALEHIHNTGWMHRDIKAENLVLDDEGFVKVIDFGMTRELDNGRASTSCGSPHYAAPQIILGETYTRSADWWSLGVVVHAMLFGSLPFDDECLPELLRKVCVGRFTFPRNVHVSSHARDFISKLLTVKESSRLGFAGPQQVKDHPWFVGMNWEKLVARQIASPYAPKETKEEAYEYPDF